MYRLHFTKISMLVLQRPFFPDGQSYRCVYFVKYYLLPPMNPQFSVCRFARAPDPFDQAVWPAPLPKMSPNNGCS
jgi:hypothetical protein